jgi:predicted AlkP superfamily pyrophosphatase or phosphodiesterase
VATKSRRVGDILAEQLLAIWVLAVMLLGLAACQQPQRRAPVVVIGIDGATWNVAGPLLRDGQMPNLAGLVARGSWSRLASIEPSLSPAIWTSIATGYPPEHHGIEGFVAQVPQTGQTTLVSSTQRRVPAVWNIASAAGRTVGVVNWWATFPAEPVNGFVVSDRANLRRRFGYRGALGLSDPGLRHIGDGETHPASLLVRILEQLGANAEVPAGARHRVVGTLPAEAQRELDQYATLVRDRRLSVLKFMLLQDHASLTAARIALSEGPTPDLLLVYLSGLDAAEHQYWAYFEPEKFRHPPPQDEVAAFREVVPGYYRYVDDLLGQLLEEVPADAIVVVVSDHGHGPNPDYAPDAPSAEYGRWASGTHGDGPPGILVVAGDGTPRGRLPEAHVYDVAPTLLALLGLPASRDMPGRELVDRLPNSRRVLPRVERGPRMASDPVPAHADVDAELLEKLRALGYIR